MSFYRPPDQNTAKKHRPASDNTVIITGGLGFIGRAVATLWDRHNWNIKIISKPPNNSGRITFPHHWLVVKESLSARTISRVFSPGAVIVHLAHGFPLHDVFNREPLPKKLQGQDLKKMTVERILSYCTSFKKFTRMVQQERRIAAAMACSRPSKIILMSSAAVYKANARRGITEQDPLQPRNMYGLSKVVVEKIYQDTFSDQLSTITCLRLFNAYGPTQPTNRLGSFIVTALEEIRHSRTIVINGDGSQLRDPMYIDDVAEALLQIALSSSSRKIYNIGSGHPVKLKLLVQKMARIANHKPIIQYNPEIQDGSFYANTDNLYKIGFRTKATFTYGIRQILSQSRVTP